MRLDKFISYTLDISRVEAKKIIKDKQIYVNDKIVSDASYRVTERDDKVFKDGNQLFYDELIYLMMNKPFGYLSATVDRNQTIMDLVDEYKKYNLFIIGRLDLDSVGLIILTNDGTLAHTIKSPKSNIIKKYYVEVEGTFIIEDVTAFREGLEISDGKSGTFITLPAQLEIVNDKSAYISIVEGKHHQIKNMCKKRGKEVKYLKRVQIGKLQLDTSLKEGEYRRLLNHEIELLKKTHKN